MCVLVVFRPTSRMLLIYASSVDGADVERAVFVVRFVQSQGWLELKYFYAVDV